ncbi:cilia- and flagella-associated protein 99 isoform X2 [Physcomitrium patens]|uniref:cilia- and flagella-associated protein 99 isoform X2 n=1 Tax=Physcomitrium patens TaxID=3218 RepID=UPI003CCDFB80
MPMCSCLSTTWSTPTTLFSSSRYQRLINAFLKHFCAVRATSLSAEDALLYKALTYLAVFRLDELKWSEFRRLCSSQVPVKVLPFIQALFLEELIISYSKEDWLKLYDGVFVNDLLRGLRLFHQEAQAYAETLAEAVYEPDEDLRYIPPPTTVIPFNLSVSNYTHPVEVEPEPFIYRAKPAPVWDKGRTLEMKRVSQVFKLNRTLLREKYSDPRYQPFRLRTLERPTNLETVREEVETKRAKECEYIVPKSGPVPSMPEIEVKLTTAALLREHSRFQKIIDSDKQKLQNLERELRDDSHMKAYENEMRIQQEIEHCMDVEFKKATVIASDQAARDSKKKHLCMNWAAASVTKEEKKRIHHEHAMLLKNIRFANRFRHHLIKEEEKVNKVKRNVIFNEKKNMVKKLNAESEDRLAVAALQRAREYQCKQELVRQLHFLEKESCYQIPKFDIDSTGGHGTLSEMSIAELRHRLRLAKLQRLQDQQRKHRDVQDKLATKRQKLHATARMVSHMRQVTRAQYLSRKAHERRKEQPSIDVANQLGM